MFEEMENHHKTEEESLKGEVEALRLQNTKLTRRCEGLVTQLGVVRAESSDRVRSLEIKVQELQESGLREMEGQRDELRDYLQTIEKQRIDIKKLNHTVRLLERSQEEGEESRAEHERQLAEMKSQEKRRKEVERSESMKDLTSQLSERIDRIKARRESIEH